MAHRRGRVGVGRLGGGPKFGKKAEEIKAVSLTSAMETVKKLEVKLTEFAKKHKKEIQNDPAFRKKFLEMCAPLGVDPLSSEKGFWKNMLGIGEFYYELAVKVAEVCLASRSRNGGIISVSEVKTILQNRKSRFTFTEDGKNSQLQKHGNKRGDETKYSSEDIIMSISKLSKLGNGFRTIKVGKSTMIVSVPTELDNDHMEVMKIAQDHQGRVTVQNIKDITITWHEDRIQRALDLLLSQGMSWMDTPSRHSNDVIYWFPSIWKEGISSGSTDE
jgi:ESCRT-II complex subunit VPS22